MSSPLALRLGVIRDFKAEKWPSMDLCADQLIAHLSTALPEILSTDLETPYRRFCSRLPIFGSWNLSFNADRLINRHLLLPRYLRGVTDLDIFHIVDHSYAHVILALPAGRAGVYCHDLDAFRSLLEPNKDLRPWWFRRLARRTLKGLRRAAVVFYSTQTVRDQLLQHRLVAPDRLVHAPYGVAAEFSPGTGPAIPLSTPGLMDQPFLLHVGSNIPRKRLDVLLDVFATVRNRIPGLRLIQVGGPWPPHLAGQLDRLQLRSSVFQVQNLSREQLAGLYHRAAAVLVPSEAEGFGLPLIEALACGAVVVASNLPVLREVGAAAALYCPVGDVPTWADTVARVLIDPGFAPSRDTRLSLAGRYSWREHARVIGDAYLRLGSALGIDRSATGSRSVWPSLAVCPTPLEPESQEKKAGEANGKRCPRGMRILFLNPVGVLGGAEKVLLTAIAGVRRIQSDATLRLLAFSDGPLLEAAAKAGAEVEVIPLPKTLSVLGDSQFRSQGLVARKLATLGQVARAIPAGCRLLRSLHASVRRFAPDVVHSNGIKTHLLAALAVPRRIPVIWHLHDFYSDRPVIARLLPRFRGRAVGGVAISEAVRLDAATLLPGLPVGVVRNAVDTYHFTPAVRDGAALDGLAGLPPAAPTTVRVGLVATYADWKGHYVFLDALAHLGDLRQIVRGYIIGGPLYATTGSQISRSDLVDRVRASGLTERVGLIPFQSDPAEVYRMLDVVVHASTRPEPFGLVIAEAMSCGRAVIVSAAGGALELFTDGHDALGHRPGDAEELAAKIARLASDPRIRQRLGAAARTTAVARFSLNRYDEEIVKVYNRVANRFVRS